MSNTIKISLDTSQYRLPTQEDITSGKQFILRREEYARVLEAKVDDCLANAAQEIVTICYKYNVDPKEFSISSKYNEQMIAEIAEVMDNAEEEILNLIYEYSLSVLDGSAVEKKNALAAWIALLGRRNKNLQDTLDGYLYKAMKDWEAAIAALRFANVAMAAAVTKVKSHLHSIYTMPEVRATFNHADDFNATYIRSKGVQKGGYGLSQNGSTNVTQMARTTLQMAWMREQGIDFDESGAVGYYQLRGSSYPCAICDGEVGFHEGLEELYTKPYPHPHCCCYRIPIFPAETSNKGETDSKTELAKEKDRLRESGEMPTEDELSTFDNIQTNKLLRSDKVKNRLLWHTFSLQELKAAKYIWNHPDKLNFERVSVLGEGKDLTMPEDANNVERKKRRKIRQYNVYSFTYQNNRWLIKLEQHRKGFEQFYSFTK